MSGRSSVQNRPIVAHDSVCEEVRLHLDIAINVEKRFTVETLSNASGVSKSAIKAYMRNLKPKEPSLSRALSLAFVIGPRAVNAITHLINYEASRLGQTGEIRPMQIVADATGHLAIIAQAGADDRIDHTEERRVMIAADALIATVLPLSSAAGRAGHAGDLFR